MSNTNKKNATTMVCKVAEGWSFINHDDIICLKANHHYTEVFVVNEEEPKNVQSNIGSLFLQLPMDIFIQCHRSYIINKRHIVYCRHKCKELVMKKGLTVRVSRYNEKRLLQICLGI